MNRLDEVKIKNLKSYKLQRDIRNLPLWQRLSAFIVLCIVLCVVLVSTSMLTNIGLYSNAEVLDATPIRENWDFVGINDSVVKGNSGYTYSKDSANMIFVGSKDANVKDSEIGPAGFKTYAASQISESDYQNYVEFTPLKNGTLYVSYVCDKNSENTKLKVFDCVTNRIEADGKEMVCSASSVKNDDNLTVKTITVPNVESGRTYYIVSENMDGYLNGGVNINNISYEWVNGKTNLMRESLEKSPLKAGYTPKHKTNSAGDVFLGGKYIELGVSKQGSFGTSVAPDSSWGFHPDTSSGVGGRLGFCVNGSGWDSGIARTTGDHFLPGSAAEGYNIGYYINGTKYEYRIADRDSGNSTSSWPVPAYATDESTDSSLKCVVRGETPEHVAYTLVYNVGVDTFSNSSDVSVVNKSGKTIENVRFSRNFDPDPDASLRGSYKTYNKVVCNPSKSQAAGAKNYSLVIARGEHTLEGEYFFAFDNKTRSSILSGLKPGSVFDSNLWDAAPTTSKTYSTNADTDLDPSSGNLNGYELKDVGIAITTNFGTMTSGQTYDLGFDFSMDPDIQRTLNDKVAIDAQPTGPTSISTRNNTDMNYALFLGSDPVSDYQSYSVPTIEWTGLDDNKAYTVKAVNKNDPLLTYEKEIYTWIDPSKRSDGNLININPSTYSINLSNCDNDYQYLLYDSNNILKGGPVKPNKGIINFEGLNKETTYTLKASSSNNPISSSIEIKTFGDFVLSTDEQLNIKVSNTQTSCQYGLFDGETQLGGWITPTGFEYIFSDSGIKPDTIYTVKVKGSAGSVTATANITTYINPLKNSKYEDVVVSADENYIYLSNADPDYQYALKEYNDKTKTAVDFDPNAVSTTRVLGRINPDLKYWLIAKRKDNSNIKTMYVEVEGVPNFEFTKAYDYENSLHVLNLTNINEKFEYCIEQQIGETSTLVIDWFQEASSSHKFMKDKDDQPFLNDTKYICKMRKAGTTEIKKEKEICTYIDPMKHPSSRNNDIEVSYGTTALSLNGAYSQYKYGLSTAFDEEPLNYKDSITKKINFEGLTKSTVYYLWAIDKNDSTKISVRVPLATQKDYVIGGYSSDQINVVGTKGYFYGITDSDTEEPTNWIEYNDSAIVFDNLEKSDTVYYIHQKDSKSGICESKSCKTFIDPYRKSDGVTKTNIHSYMDDINNWIVVENADPNYQYGILNDDGSGVGIPSLWWSVDSATSTCIIKKLNETDNICIDTKYSIKAKYVDTTNSNSSDACPVRTHESFTWKTESCEAISVNGNIGYEYAISEPNDEIIGEWQKKAEDTDEIVFDNLERCDFGYIIHQKLIDGESKDSSYIDKITAFTGLDASRKAGYKVDDESGSVNTYQNINSITLTNLDKANGYLYKISSDNSSSGYQVPTDQASFTFGNLNPDTEYTISASKTENDDNTCKSFVVRTLKDYKVETVSDKSVKFNGWKDFTYELYSGNNQESPLKTVTLTQDEQEVVFTADDGLISDHLYVVKQIAPDSIPQLAPDQRDGWTKIDPLISYWGDNITIPEVAEDVIPYLNINKITLEKVQYISDFEYTLTGKDGYTKTIKPDSSTMQDIICFDNLEPDTEYTLTASNNYNVHAGSIEQKLVTHKELKAKANSSKIICAEANNEYEYNIAYNGQLLYDEWQKPSSEYVYFKDLLYCDAKYTIYARLQSEDWVTDKKYWDFLNVNTWIDANRRQNTTEESGQISIYENIDYITLENLDSNYFYKLVKDSSSTSFTKPVDGKIVFSKQTWSFIKPDTKYKLYASHTTIEQDCDAKEITTFKDFSFETTSSTSLNVTGNKDFCYQVVLPEYGYISQEQIASKDGDVLIFDKLPKSDSIYQIKSIYIPYKAKGYYDIRSDRSWINPALNPSQSPIIIRENFNRITLLDIESSSNYMYKLVDSEGQGVCEYISPTTGYVVFKNLDANTNYYLMAKDGNFEKSDKVLITTHKDYSLTPLSVNSLKTTINDGYKYALYKAGTTPPDASRFGIYSDSEHTFETDVDGNSLLYDTKYVVAQIKNDTDLLDTHEAWTFIEPFCANGSQIENVTNENEGDTTNSFTLKNCDASYKYALKDKSGGIIFDYVSPEGDDNKVILGDQLQNDTTYQLVAKHSDGTNDNSMEIPLTTTGNNIDSKSTSSITFRANLFAGYTYILKAVDDATHKETELKTWLQTIDEEESLFNNIEWFVENTEYKLYCRKTERDVYNVANVRTWCDPQVQEDHIQTVVLSPTANNVFITKVKKDYQYGLFKMDGITQIGEYVAPYLDGSDYKVQLGNSSLKGKTSYIVKAIYYKGDIKNLNSDPYEVITHSTVRGDIVGDNGHGTFDVDYKDGVMDYSYNEIPAIPQINVYHNAKLTFSKNNHNEFVILYEVEGFSQYNISYHIKANALSGYNFSHWTYNGDEIDYGIGYEITGDVNPINITAHYLHQGATLNVTADTGHESLSYDYSRSDYGKSITDSGEIEWPVGYTDTNVWVNTEYTFEGNVMTEKYKNDGSVMHDTTDVTITANPYEYYDFYYWAFDNKGELVPVEKGKTYQFTAVNESVKVVAVYKHQIGKLDVVCNNGWDGFDYKFTENGQTTEEKKVDTYSNKNVWVNTTYTFEDSKISSTYTDRYGQEQTLELTSNAYDGYNFDHWNLNGQEVDVESTYTTKDTDENINIEAVYKHDIVSAEIGGANGHTAIESECVTEQYFPQVSDDKKATGIEYTDENIWKNSEIVFNNDSLLVSYKDEFEVDEKEIKAKCSPFEGYSFDHWILNDKEVENGQTYDVDGEENIYIRAFYSHNTGTVNFTGASGHDSFDWELNIETSNWIEPEHKDVPQPEPENIFANKNGEKVNYASATGIENKNESGKDSEYSFENVWENAEIIVDDKTIKIDYQDKFNTDSYKATVSANESAGYKFNHWTLNGAELDGSYVVKGSDAVQIEPVYDFIPVPVSAEPAKDEQIDEDEQSDDAGFPWWIVAGAAGSAAVIAAGIFGGVRYYRKIRTNQ